MLVTALSPVIRYDKASKTAHYAMDNDLTLKAPRWNWALLPRPSSTVLSIRRRWSSIRRASQLMEAFMCTPIPVSRMRR
jgi:hypothetical protein